MKKLLLLMVLISAQACAQWGTFGYRDPSQDSIYYKYILIQSESDVVGVGLSSSVQGLLDINSSTLLDDVAGIRINANDSATTGAAIQLYGRASGDDNFIFLSLPSGSKSAMIAQDSTEFFFRTSGLPYVFYHKSGSDPVELARIDTLGDATFKNMNLTGTFALSADTTVTYEDPGTQNISAGGYSVIRLDEGGVSGSVVGISGGTDGRMLILINVGSTDTDIANQSSSASAADRIITGTGSTVTLAPNGVMRLWYDSTTERWRQI